MSTPPPLAEAAPISPRVFRNQKPAGWPVVAAIVGAVFMIGCLVLTFIGMLLAPASSKNSMMPGMIGGMSVVPMMLVAYAVWRLRSPKWVAVGEDGLVVERYFGRRRFVWGEIARLRREKFDGALTSSASGDVLVLLDVRGKVLVKLTSELEGFDVLAAEVEARSTAARGERTYDVDASVAARRKRMSRNATFVAVAGVFLVVAGAFTAWHTLDESRKAARLDAEGVAVSARIVGREMVRVTAWLTFVVDDGRGVEHTHRVMMESAAWRALEGAETVEVVAVPGRPEIARLARGEVKSQDLPTPILIIVGIFATLGGVAMVTMRLFSIADVRVKDGRLRVVRIHEVTTDRD